MAPVAYAARPTPSHAVCVPSSLRVSPHTMSPACPDRRSSPHPTSDPSSQDADEVLRSLFAFRISDQQADRITDPADARSSSSGADATVAAVTASFLSSREDAPNSSPSPSAVPSPPPELSPQEDDLRVAPSPTSLSSGLHAYPQHLHSHMHHSHHAPLPAPLPGLMPLVYGHPQPVAQSVPLYPLHDPASASRRDGLPLHARVAPVAVRRPAGHGHTLGHPHVHVHGTATGVPRIKNDLYKTEICRSFAENGGYCKYGAKCQFAHGEAELRPVRRHPRYKTKLCRNYSATGSCPYDARCRFIHAPTDYVLSVPHNSSYAPSIGASTSENVLTHAHNASQKLAGMGSGSAQFASHSSVDASNLAACYSNDLMGLPLLPSGASSSSMTSTSNVASAGGVTVNAAMVFSSGFDDTDTINTNATSDLRHGPASSPLATSLTDTAHSSVGNANGGSSALDFFGNGNYGQSLLSSHTDHSMPGIPSSTAVLPNSSPRSAISTDISANDRESVIVNSSDLFERLSLNFRGHTQSHPITNQDPMPPRANDHLNLDVFSQTRAASSHSYVMSGSTRSRLPVFRNMASGQE